MSGYRPRPSPTPTIEPPRTTDFTCCGLVIVATMFGTLTVAVAGLIWLATHA